MLNFRTVSLFVLLLTSFNAWAGIDFTDTADHVNCGSDTSLDITGDQTLATWFNTDSFAVEFYTFGKDAGTEGTASENAQYSMVMETGKTLKFFWENGTGTNVFASSSSAATINTGEWHHMAITRDVGATTTVKFYFDGVQLGSDSTGHGNPSGGESSVLTLGALRTSGTNGINGRMMEAAMWDSVLTDAEIEQLFLARFKRMPLQIQPSNLQGYWPLDDHPDGTALGSLTFNDYSQNTNNCTDTDSDGDSDAIADKIGYP